MFDRIGLQEATRRWSDQYAVPRPISARSLVATTPAYG
jgi:hypothetical protein